MLLLLFVVCVLFLLCCCGPVTDAIRHRRFLPLVRRHHDPHVCCFVFYLSAPRKKASTQQLASKFTVLAPPSSTLSVASAPVSPHKDRELGAVALGLPHSSESISLPATPTASENRSHCLPENGFFLAVMSVYWSNLVGPRIEQVHCSNMRIHD
jgi:hypothetical protein